MSTLSREVQVQSDENARKFFNAQFANVMKISPNVSVELMCVKLAYAMLREGGKAFVLAPAMTTTRKTDLPLRRLYVNGSLIESVVALPKGILKTSSVSLVGYVISKNNSRVKFIDASCVNLKKDAVSPDGTIDKISDDRKLVKDVSVGEIKKHQYCLNPEEYLLEPLALKSPVKLKDVCVAISRRAFNKTSEVVECEKNDASKVSAVKIAHFDDGFVSPGLVAEEELKKTIKGVKLQNGDVLVSKIASPVKAAIYEQETEVDAFAQENIYVLRVDADRIDLYYLCAFFNSSIGTELLRRQAGGSYIPTITLGDLKKLEVPLLDRSAQTRIGEGLKARCKKVRQLREQLEMERTQIMEVCDEKTILKGKE